MNQVIHPLSGSASIGQFIPLESALDASRCGHKAAALAVLLNGGFDVPNGFVIPVGATLDPLELAAALEWLGEGPFAVRSSGTAEDLDDASFAGQYESVLNVAAADVAAAAERCVASAGAAHVALYAGAVDAPPSGMAVLVQRMVPADAAGVMFSADPISGDRTSVVINATRGLGDRLVAGEVDGDLWRVGASGAVAGVQPHAALDRATAEQLAALARGIEALRGVPQDVEWAIAGGKLFVLQARAITALPVPPKIETPRGTWEKDAGHFPEPVCPFAASTHLHGESMTDLMPNIGLMPDSMEFRVIGHEAYMHIEPDDGGAKAPPWWVIAIAVRVVPSIRRKMRRAEELFRTGYFEELPRRWNSSLAAAQKVELTRRASIDLSALSDSALLAHVRELRQFAVVSMRLHFELMFPHTIGMHELCLVCSEFLGWDTAKAAQLVQGLSSASAAPMHQLAKIADLARGRDATRQAIEAGGPQVAERLREVDAEVHAMLIAFIEDWGLRTFGPECSAPNLAERPDLIASSIADLIRSGGLPDLEPERQRLIAEARAALQTGDARKRFDDALAYAELVYPIREDNVILTDQMVIGLVRLAALELGRRLKARGLIREVQDVMMLTVDQTEQHLTSGADARATVDRVRREMAWVRANPGPAAYGPPPAAPPSLRGLPAAGRRVNESMLFMMMLEFTKPQPHSGDVYRGLGVSTGVYRGRVRVITSSDQLHLLQQGEVLVCPSTCAAWMMVFHRAGAIVTEHGSVLTHTSIVAREHRLPAVVAVHDATKMLVDGDEVVVDGSQGTVARVV